MDSGLGSDDDHHHPQQFPLGSASSSFVLGEMAEPPKTKDQKQLRNRLLSMEAADEERRRGAMLFSTRKASQDDLEKKATVNGEPEIVPLTERDVAVWGSESAMSTSRGSENLMSSSETLVLSETCGDTPYNSMLEVSDVSAEGARESRSLRRKPMGFFVDLSQIISDGAEASKPEPSSSSGVPSNRNIFSMVIDFEAPKKDKPVKLTSSLCRRPVKQPVVEATPVKNPKKPTMRPVQLLNLKGLNGVNHKCQSRNRQTTRRLSTDIDSGNNHSTSQRTVPVDFTDNQGDVDEENGLSTCYKPSEPVDDQDHASHKTVQSFVKLSDMKPLTQPSNDEEVVTHSTVMSRSVPEVTSWLESPLSTMVLTYRSTIQPSRDNVSENELFDKQTASDTAQPVSSNGSYDTNMNHLEGLTRQPKSSINEERPSDGWEWSRPCDLDHLSEFRGEVKIESSNGRILRGHRNVLVSRCRYFAGALGAEPSSKNGRSRHHVLSLKDFTYESLRFALRYVYSGVLSHSSLPGGPAQLEELAHLADVLGIEGLRDFIEWELVRHMFAECVKLRKTTSANFGEAVDSNSQMLRDSLQNITAEYNTAIGFRSHSCSTCLSRCLLVLPLASSRNLEELQRSCVSFLAANFREAWLLREFHSLAPDLRERCLREKTASVGVESCLKTRLECEKLRADVLSLGWEEAEVGSAMRLVDRLEEELRGFLGRSFTAVLASRHVTGLDDIEEEGVEELLAVVSGWMLEAAAELGVEQACRAYSRCWKMLETQLWAKRSFMEMLVKIRIRLEQVLVDQADRLIRSNAWLRLDTKLRKRIKELAPKNLDVPYPRSRLPVPPQKKPLLPSNKTVHPTIAATNRTRPTDLGGVIFQETGGVSLRRSLLLAAKAPQAQQAHAPPTNQRRVSSLTRPTAASAAKSVKSAAGKGTVVKRREEGGRRSDSPSASDHSVVSPKFGDRRKGGNFRESPKKETASPHRVISPRFSDRRTLTNFRGGNFKESPKKEVASPSPKFGDRRKMTNSKGAHLRESPKKEAVSHQRGPSLSPRLGDRRGCPKGVSAKEVMSLRSSNVKSSSAKQGVSQKTTQKSSSKVVHSDDSKSGPSNALIVDDVQNQDGSSPRMRRSSTFLKDEPTVLGKLIN